MRFRSQPAPQNARRPNKRTGNPSPSRHDGLHKPPAIGGPVGVYHRVAPRPDRSRRRVVAGQNGSRQRAQARPRTEVAFIADVFEKSKNLPCGVRLCASLDLGGFDPVSFAARSSAHKNSYLCPRVPGTPLPETEVPLVSAWCRSLICQNLTHRGVPVGRQQIRTGWVFPAQPN